MRLTRETDTLSDAILRMRRSPLLYPNAGLRYEQLEDIREVVVELQHQIRLLRRTLDELNEDLPERVKRWSEGWHQEYLPVEELVNAFVASLPAAATPMAPPAKSRPGETQ